jgi:CheY-like chemotaxis protein
MASILVVDDDRHIREVVRFALEQAGHHVTEAADGAQACVLSERESFDVIVLDILMPGMDGLDVCRHIRSTPLWGDSDHPQRRSFTERSSSFSR